MAFFECTIGGSGDGVALIVQCDANFAGSTITADNGEDVFTEICPSVSPYTVRFEGIPTGTFTISGVSQGQTFTTQFTVLDYETTLNATPDGATVLPINDIQTWLHCANIWNKSYTTINQVLADTSTLLALISSNNATDYMARSTNWASSVCANQTAMGYIGNNDYCANKLLANSTWCSAICNSSYFESVLTTKIPTMTSNTTPSGYEVTFSSQLNDNRGYYAFDGNDSTNWYSQNTADEHWIKIKVPTSYVVKRIYFMGHPWTNTLKIQGSTNGTSGWVDLTSNFTNNENNFVIANNTTKYQYFRLITVNSPSNGYISANRLQFYGRA